MSDPNTIYLVDDEADLRKALNRLLSTEGLSVVEFESAEAFLAALPPDGSGCVLLDLAMSGIDGLEAQRQMAERGSRLPIIFLTAQGGIPETVRAVKAGAVDFLAKPVKRDDLLKAIASALELASASAEEARLLKLSQARLAKLTPREREVFEHVISGAKNKVIADRLGTSEQTIKVHRGRVMEKMEVESLADLVRLAGLLGIAPASEAAD